VIWMVLIGLAFLGWGWWTRRIGLRWLLPVLLVGVLLGQTSAGHWVADRLSSVGSGIASGAMRGAK
jgi:hypothetical protein